MWIFIPSLMRYDVWKIGRKRMSDSLFNIIRNMYKRDKAIGGECSIKLCNSSPVGWGLVTKLTLCQRPVAIWALLSRDGV